MIHIDYNDDGSVLIKKSLFDELMESNDIVELSFVIEKRGGQINFLGTKLKRQGAEIDEFKDRHTQAKTTSKTKKDN